MSDSPRHNRMAGNTSSGPASHSIVRPHPITESSLMDSVAGFITEVQALHQQALQTQSGEGKIHVTWAKFEKTDINDSAFYSELMEINGNHPPLLLVLGYTQGVQVWLIPASGEAQEVLSWKYGQVKTLKVLPTPENVYGSPDNFAHCRPLVVMVDSAGPGTAFSAASFTSLKTGEVVQNIKFNSEIGDVSVNRRIVVIAFKEKLAAFDACNLEARFTVSTCYPSPGVHVNPIALGCRWLAFADQRLVTIHRSMGGMEVEGGQSVTAWGINVGSKLAQGVSKFYNNFFSGSGSSHSTRSSHSSGSMSSQNEPQKGVVTVLDIIKVYRQDRDEVMLGDKIDGVVAHFIAHNKAIVAMEFDSNGSLLLTCDRLGNYFNLFRIVPHPAGSCYAAVHHLYSLYRGDTPGSVQDIAFSPDSRWVAVSTLRGTTHIFPISPYGGPVGVRTHTSNRVVNRLSRFHRSAGLDEHLPAGRTNSSSGRSSPNPLLGSSPVFSKLSLDPISSLPLVIPYPNPHVPPFPNPTLVQPVAQLRQPYLVTLTNQTLGTAASGVGARKPKLSGSGSSSHNVEDIPIRLAVTFAPSRAWLVGGSQNSLFHRQSRRIQDSLFVVASHGVLLEYILEPIPDSTLPKDKICESSPIELQVTAYGQWTLTPPIDRGELQPPVSPDNPLLTPLDCIARWNSKRESSTIGSQDLNTEEQWLSQVEIVTHIGPHRRLWMGPQFCFKTKRRIDGGRTETEELDVTLRPQQSNPMNMPRQEETFPVMIEASSASSYELSPHFANQVSGRGSQEQVHNDVESELQEAMSENVLGEESLLDGHCGVMQHSNKIVRKSSWRYSSGSYRPRGDSVEEEFFCLTPEDTRSVASSSGRSRNASATSVSSAKVSLPMQMGVLPDTKIFSVAVEAKQHDRHHRSDVIIVSDVDADYTSHFAVVSSKKSVNAGASVNIKSDKLIGVDFGVHKDQKLKKDCNDSEAIKKSKKKKNKKSRSSEESGAEDSSTQSFTEKCRQKDNDFDVVPLKSDDFCREVTPKMETDETFEMTTSENFNVVEKTENLLADALMSVEIKSDRCEASVEIVRAISPTPSEDFKEMCRQDDEADDAEFHEMKKFDDEEDVFVVRESHSPSPEVSAECCEAEIDHFKATELDSLEEDKTDAIVKSIESAKKLYEDEDHEIPNPIDGTSTRHYVGNSIDSSEDDMDPKPMSRRPKKSKKKVDKTENEDPGTPASCYADSESSILGGPEKPDGWSFEADDQDLSKLIADFVINRRCVDDEEEESRAQQSEEKTVLDEIFKFDSEIAAKSQNCDFFDKDDASGNQATDSENDFQAAESKNLMSTSLGVSNDDSEKSDSRSSLSQSLVYGAGSETSSSVGNSPNPKKNKAKAKKKKRR